MNKLLLKSFISCSSEFRSILSRLAVQRYTGVDTKLFYDMVYCKEYINNTNSSIGVTEDMLLIYSYLTKTLDDLDIDCVIDKKKKGEYLCDYLFDYLQEQCKLPLILVLVTIFLHFLNKYTSGISVGSERVQGIIHIFSVVSESFALICMFFGLLVIAINFIYYFYYIYRNIPIINIDDCYKFKRNRDALSIMYNNKCGDSDIDSRIEYIHNLKLSRYDINYYINIVKVEFLYKRYREISFCEELESIMQDKKKFKGSSKKVSLGYFISNKFQ